MALDAPSRDSSNVLAAVDKIIAAASAAGIPIWVMANNIKEAEQLAEQGASAFIISSDQALLRKAWVDVVKQFKQSFD